MTDILVTYEDGSTELRPASCPALAGDSPTAWRPTDFTMADVVPARPEPVVAFLRPGERRGTHALRAWRWSAAMVWCITGGYGKGEPLTGEWRLCRVKTMAEQIERLTLGRDAGRGAQARVALPAPDQRAGGDRDARAAREGEEGRVAAVITKEQREKDRAICEAATPPPWHRLGCLTMDSCVESDATRECMPRMTADIDGSVAGDVEARANADLIARAREALPAYIAAAEEMERRIAEAEAAAEAAKEMALRGPADACPEYGARYRGMLQILRILRGER